MLRTSLMRKKVEKKEKREERGGGGEGGRERERERDPASTNFEAKLLCKAPKKSKN